jgi:uncharacterized protein
MDAALVLVPLVSFVAGIANAVAGGGTFFTFPALTGLAGLSEKAANITSTIGLWPGSAASVLAARPELRRVPRHLALRFGIISLVGGSAGSVLLLLTSNEAFKLLVPWLLAFATVVFGFSARISRWAKQRSRTRPELPVLVALVQLLVALYGGYFGAGIGILMLAGLAFSGVDDLHVLNGLKVLLATLINGIAVVVFVAHELTRGDAVAWRYAIPMAVLSSAGGFAGIAVARRLPQDRLRAFILVIGVVLSAAYFYKEYL